MQAPAWFESWFNSPHYHLLYKGRDESEAKGFIERLTMYLSLPSGARILDLACGKGRHSISLAEMGFDVLGVDIAPENIAQASKHAHQHLRFGVHDMRYPLQEPPFDAVLNLFTSFGYFENEAEHQLALHTMAQALKPTGTLVIDYLNVGYVRSTLNPFEKKEIDGITFIIQRTETPTHFIKEIEVNDPTLGQPMRFQEKVARFTLPDFERMLMQEGMLIRSVFGDYGLHGYDADKSPRMILVASRN